VVSSNQSVTVSGIVLTNISTTNVEITFSDSDDTQILSVAVPGESTVEIETDFVADNGIKADLLNSNQVITFFHSQPGA
jgi:hypothetical protein